MTSVLERKAAKRPTKLFNLNFSLLWAGQSVSRVGDQLFSIALTLWLKHATGSATVIGVVMMLTNLPGILLGPIGGAVADRYSRRKVILISDFLLGVSVFLFGGVMYFFPERTDLLVVLLVITSTLIAIGNAFFSPAISAAIPDLVPKEKIDGANSLSQISMQLAVFLGQGAGGVLFRVLGAPLLFILDAVTYWVATACEFFISIPQKIPEHTHTWKEQFGEFKQDTIGGLKYVMKQSGLRELVLLSALQNFFFVPIILLLPFFVEDVLLLSEDWYGFILVAYGIGALVGYLAAGTLRVSTKDRGMIMIACILVEAVGYALLGLSKTSLMAMILVFLGGGVTGVVQVYIMTILQLTTPAEIRGRIFGVLSTIAGSITPIAMGLTGIIADLLNQNIPLIYVGCGVITLTITVFFMTQSDFRNFLTSEPSLHEQQQGEGDLLEG